MLSNKRYRATWSDGMLCAITSGETGINWRKDREMDRSSGHSGLLLAIALSALAIVALLLSNMARAAGNEPIETYTLTFEADGDQGTVIIEDAESATQHHFDLDDVKVSTGTLTIVDDLVVTPDGIVSNGQLYSIANLRVEEMYQDGDIVSVVLKNRMSSTAARGRRNPKNWVTVAEELEVGQDDFVRGDAICFGASVVVGGEVNRNVVALFGDVTVKTDGIVRGGVVAFGGRINVRGEGAIYGDLVSSHGIRKSDRSRIRLDEDGYGLKSFDVNAHYNRADGLHLGGRFNVADPDSNFPTLYAGAGYAFEAERWRYEIGAHQRIFDEYSFAFGGSFFRQTSTDDNWLSSRWETTILALMASEDFADYYDEEGGRFYLAFNPGYYNELGASYSFSKLGWMDHHPRLWSLFGWEKEFRANFSSIPADERMESRNEFDSKLGLFTAWYTLDTRDDLDDTYSGWWGHIEYQSAGGRLKGDLDFDRFTAEVRRYQPVMYRQRLNARLKYGTSGRDLPLFREFYLGGMRTLRGLDHKSLRGEQMILGNVEYVIDFPWLTFQTALLLDVGKVVSREESIFSDGDFHSSMGIRLGFDEGLRVEVAKSLDDMDESVKLWVLFQKSF